MAALQLCVKVKYKAMSPFAAQQDLSAPFEVAIK